MFSLAHQTPESETDLVCSRSSLNQIDTVSFTLAQRKIRLAKSAFMHRGVLGFRRGLNFEFTPLGFIGKFSHSRKTDWQPSHPDALQKKSQWRRAVSRYHDSDKLSNRRHSQRHAAFTFPPLLSFNFSTPVSFFASIFFAQ